MNSPSAIDEQLLRRAYELAHFAHPDGDIADHIIADALAAVATRTSRSLKSWWQQLRGGHRSTHPIAVGPALLQRLVLEKSDEYARREGDREACTQSDKTLLARYLHCLLLRCLQATSRWAAVGICQLVYDYRGPQVDEMISCVIGREWDESNRKRVKKDLMHYLTNRFAGLRVASLAGGAGRHFEPTRDQQGLRTYANQILTTLIPWGSEEHVLAKGMDPCDAPLLDETRYPKHKNYLGSLSKLEFNRYHVFIDPLCFRILVHSFRARTGSENGLHLPQLQRCDGSTPQNPEEKHQADPAASRRSPELAKRIECLAEEQRKRRHGLGNFDLLRIRVDGTLVAVLDSAQATAVLTLDHSFNIIQAFAVSPSGEVLVATHILDHSDNGELSDSIAGIDLGRRWTLYFDVRSDSDEHRQVSATCRVRLCQSWFAALAHFRWTMLSAASAAIVLCVLLTIWMSRFSRRRVVVSRQNANHALLVQPSGQPTHNRASNSYTLSPEASRLGSSGSFRPIPVIQINDRLELVLRLPVAAGGTYAVAVREPDVVGSSTFAARLEASGQNPLLELKLSTQSLRADTTYIVTVSPEDHAHDLSYSEYFVFTTGSR